jgi:hypothetical protein
MAYVIIGDVFSFPEGDASTNRVYTYAKGFIENGINSHVICFGNEYTHFSEGISEGIFYYHPFGQTRKNKYFIIRNWLKILKHFRTVSILRRINKKDKVKVIIVYTRLFGTHLFAWFLSKISGSKLLVESGEHPLRMHRKTFIKQKNGIN